MKILKRVLLAVMFVFFVASPVMVIATPHTTEAKATTIEQCEQSILGIPPWYRGLTKIENGQCVIATPTDVDGLSNFIWRIALNVIQMALVATSWVAFFFILYGGFLFLTGGGSSAQVEKGRKTIFNAVIGLVISLGAIAITNLIFGNLLQSTPSAGNDYKVPQIDPEIFLRDALNLAYYIAGIVAVIVIIIAGLMYTTSMGDSGRVTRAKNMILYAVIGIGVLGAAWAITNYVILRFQ